jgi:hypothetical protein
MIYPTPVGVATITQRDGTSIAKHYQVLQRTPRYIAVPDKYDPLAGTVIRQGGRDDTARASRYDLNPDTFIKRAQQRLELFRNRHRVIKIP